MLSPMAAPSRLRPSILFVLSLLALFLVVALVWAMIMEERRARSLGLQFDIYRASAALVEAWLDNPEASLIGGPVLGFGVYDVDGKAISAQGSAPARIDRSAGSFVISESGPGGATIKLMRPMPAPGGPGHSPGSMRGGYGKGYGFGNGGGFGSGGGNGAQSRGWGGWSGGGAGAPMGGMMGPPGLGQAPASPLGQLFASPRTMWLEYAVPPRPLGETFLLLGGFALTLVLVGIYLFVLVLVRRNDELRERESRNRELAELGQAARTLVHEIKNPLGVIGIQAATLRRREGEDSPTGRAAMVIDGEVRRLAGMADRIREFLKAGPGEPREVDLLAFMREFAARHDPEGGAFAAGEGAEGWAGGQARNQAGGQVERPGRIELSLPGDFAKALVEVDSDRLALALDNLVANAREADPAGCVSLELARKGRFWLLSVGDRGNGVGAESVGRLSSPFLPPRRRAAASALPSRGASPGAPEAIWPMSRGAAGGLFSPSPCRPQVEGEFLPWTKSRMSRPTK